MRKSMMVCAAALLTFGCATQAQRVSVAIQTTTQTANAQLKTCMAGVYAAPEYAVFSAKLPEDSNLATLQQLIDSSLVTDAEIAAIEAVHPRSQTCRQAFLSQLSTATPTIVPILIDEVNDNETSLIDLIQKKQSWGAHVRRVKDVEARASRLIVVEIQKINGQLAQSNEAELGRRRAAFAAMSRYMQNQQIINNMNRL